MGREVLTDEQRREICQLYRSGMKKSALAAKYGVSPASINYTLSRFSEELSPSDVPLPNGYQSLMAAFMDFSHCNALGFNSESATAYCRSKGIQLNELKEFGQWAFQNLELVDKNLTKRYSDNLSDLQQKCNQLEKDKARDAQALAEAARVTFLNKQLQDELEQERLEQKLIKKVVAILQG